MKLYHIVGVTVMVGLAGCVTNSYKIDTKYTNPADSVTIEGHVEGKATVGKIAYTFQKVLAFVDAEYLKKK